MFYFIFVFVFVGIGFSVVVSGSVESIGGTSAAAPTFAAVIR
jgi:hypothetical protein